jgi:hypothetical protein
MRNLELRSNQRGAVLHRPQTESRLATRIRHSLAVIADLKADVLSLDIEAHLNSARAGVLERVRERFLRDAVEVIGRGRTAPEPGHFAHQDFHARSRRLLRQPFAPCVCACLTGRWAHFESGEFSASGLYFRENVGVGIDVTGILGRRITGTLARQFKSN